MTSVRTHIRAVLDSLPAVAPSEELARTAVARMSDQERVDALISLLPRLIRDEDRRRARDRATGAAGDAEAWAAAAEYRVRLGGEDQFLSDVDTQGVDELATMRLRAGANIPTTHDTDPMKG